MLLLWTLTFLMDIILCSANVKQDVGAFHLDINQSIIPVKQVSVKRQKIIAWKEDKTPSSSFILTVKNTRIQCTSKGIIKVELTISIDVIQRVRVESVLLCVKLVRTNQKTCQPLMPVRSKHRYVLPLYLFWSYHVIAGDLIEFSAVGITTIQKVEEYNRLLMYYLISE